MDVEYSMVITIIDAVALVSFVTSPDVSYCHARVSIAVSPMNYVLLVTLASTMANMIDVLWVG